MWLGKQLATKSFHALLARDLKSQGMGWPAQGHSAGVSGTHNPRELTVVPHLTGCLPWTRQKMRSFHVRFNRPTVPWRISSMWQTESRTPPRAPFCEVGPRPPLLGEGCRPLQGPPQLQGASFVLPGGPLARGIKAVSHFRGGFGENGYTVYAWLSPFAFHLKPTTLLVRVDPNTNALVLKKIIKKSLSRSQLNIVDKSEGSF